MHINPQTTKFIAPQIFVKIAYISSISMLQMQLQHFPTVSIAINVSLGLHYLLPQFTSIILVS
jgi:hypothetical protein